MPLLCLLPAGLSDKEAVLLALIAILALILLRSAAKVWRHADGAAG